MEDGSLMEVDSIAECSKAIQFCNTFDLHKAIIGIENQFCVCVCFFSGPLRQVLLYFRWQCMIDI